MCALFTGEARRYTRGYSLWVKFRACKCYPFMLAKQLACALVSDEMNFATLLSRVHCLRVEDD